MAAAWTDEHEVLLGLLAAGANKDLKNNDGETPLHIAVKEGNQAIVDALIKEGANVNQQNVLGETPLHIAVYYSHQAIVEALKREKAV